MSKDLIIDRKALSLALQKVLKDQHLSIKELADSISVNEKNLEKWTLNQAKVMPSKEELDRFCEKYNVDEESLIKKEVKPTAAENKQKEKELIDKGDKYYVYNNSHLLSHKLFGIILSLVIAGVIIAQSSITIYLDHFWSIPSIFNLLTALIFLSTIVSLLFLKPRVKLNTFNKTMIAHLIHLDDKLQVSTMKLSFRFNVIVILNLLFSVTDLFSLFTQETTKGNSLIYVVITLAVVSVILGIALIKVMSIIVKNYDRVAISYNGEEKVYILQSSQIKK